MVVTSETTIDTMMNTRERMPSWESWCPTSPQEVIDTVVEEGLNRLLFIPTERDRNLINHLLCDKLGRTAGNEVDAYLFSLAVSAGSIAARLGAALAWTQPASLAAGEDFDAWLLRAAKAARLDGKGQPDLDLVKVQTRRTTSE